jgi:hypothetical protein
MKTAGDYRAEAMRLRELARDATDPEALKALRDLIEELEAEAGALENGA